METITTTTDKVGTLHLPKANVEIAGTPQPGTATAHEAVDRSAQIVHDAVERVATKAAAIVNDTDSAAPDAPSGLADFLDSDWAESARNEVRAHPIAAVGIALLVGVAISRL